MKCIKIHNDGNVAVAVEPLKTGEPVNIDGNYITLKNDISAEEYLLLAPLAAKAFLVEDERKIIYLKPSNYNGNLEALKEYFSGCSHEDYVKGSHMDFDIIVPLAQAAENNGWGNSKLEKVEKYILSLL